jgi:cation transport regulator ChaC
VEVERVFAYGSLMYEPELPAEILGREWVRLPGHHRAFNKWSIVRGCHPDAARWPDTEVPPFFRTDRLNRSLVLGTEPGGEMIGINLLYPKSVAPELLRRSDRREGFYPDKEPSESGYLRRRVQLVSLETGAPVEAWTYLRNPESEFYLPGLDPQTVVKVLARATPREQSATKVKGAGYFVNIARVLRANQVFDAEMEALWSALQGESDGELLQALVSET